MTDRTDEKRLDPELKARWLFALRSGHYEQGDSELCTRVDDEDGDKFKHCCLGVLANVYGLENSRIAGECGLDDVGLHDLLGRWSAQGDNDHSFCLEAVDTHTTWQRKLAAMNDSGKSFAEIADFIEANL